MVCCALKGRKTSCGIAITAARHEPTKVIAAGADAVAVVTAVFGARDTLAAAQAFARLFRHNENIIS